MNVPRIEQDQTSGLGWFAWKDKPLIVLQCPHGHRRTFGRSVHTILEDGTVTPSAVCTEPGCDFHEWVKLEGYTNDKG